jgi:hypothetical protein
LREAHASLYGARHSESRPTIDRRLETATKEEKMKKILLGLVAAACLTSFALPTMAEEGAPAEGGEKKAKKGKGKKKKGGEEKTEEKKGEEAK